MVAISIAFVGEFTKAHEMFPLFFILTLYIARYTGMRISEICDLQIRNIDLQKRMIRVVDNYGKGLKTKSSARTIPIPDELYEMLSSYYLNRVKENKWPNASFIVNTRKQKIQPHALRKYLRKLQNIVGFRVGYHFLRHTFAVYAFEKYTLNEIKAIMGHASPAMTLIYADIVGRQIIDTGCLLLESYKGGF